MIIFGLHDCGQVEGCALSDDERESIVNKVVDAIVDAILLVLTDPSFAYVYKYLSPMIEFMIDLQLTLIECPK